MQTSSKSPPRIPSPAEELFDLTIKYLAVWGTSAGIGSAVYTILRSANLLTYGWRLGISMLVTYLAVLTIFVGGSKRPDLREAFLAWRYAIAILIAVYVGYSWHADAYSKSNEALVNNAVRWACSRNQQCVHAAEQYLADKNLD